MIPSVNGILIADLEVESLPSKNYMMHIDGNRISGFCDKQDAVKQAIYKILNTERYQYIIYSWNYGIQLSDLFGEPVEYVCPELERRINDALLVDDRINSCENFEFDISQKGSVVVKFRVNTIYGDIDVEKVVNIF